MVRDTHAKQAGWVSSHFLRRLNKSAHASYQVSI